MLIVTVLPHTCELHQCFSVLVFGDQESRHFLSWQMVHQVPDWLFRLKNTAAGLLVPTPGLDNSDLHHKCLQICFSCEAVWNNLKRQVDVNKKKTALKSQPRHVSGPFCRGDVSMLLFAWVGFQKLWLLPVLNQSGRFLFSFLSFIFFYRPVVPMWHSLMWYNLHTHRYPINICWWTDQHWYQISDRQTDDFGLFLYFFKCVLKESVFFFFLLLLGFGSWFMIFSRNMPIM